MVWSERIPAKANAERFLGLLVRFPMTLMTSQRRELVVRAALSGVSLSAPPPQCQRSSEIVVFWTFAGFAERRHHRRRRRYHQSLIRENCCTFVK
jgi:hypothetical protein